MSGYRFDPDGALVYTRDGEGSDVPAVIVNDSGSGTNSFMTYINLLYTGEINSGGVCSVDNTIVANIPINPDNPNLHTFEGLIDSSGNPLVFPFAAPSFPEYPGYFVKIPITGLQNGITRRNLTFYPKGGAPIFNRQFYIEPIFDSIKAGITCSGKINFRTGRITCSTGKIEWSSWLDDGEFGPPLSYTLAADDYLDLGSGWFTDTAYQPALMIAVVLGSGGSSPASTAWFTSSGGGGGGGCIVSRLDVNNYQEWEFSFDPIISEGLYEGADATLKNSGIATLTGKAGGVGKYNGDGGLAGGYDLEAKSEDFASRYVIHQGYGGNGGAVGGNSGGTAKSVSKLQSGISTLYYSSDAALTMEYSNSGGSSNGAYGAGGGGSMFSQGGTTPSSGDPTRPSWGGGAAGCNPVTGPWYGGSPVICFYH